MAEEEISIPYGWPHLDPLPPIPAVSYAYAMPLYGHPSPTTWPYDTGFRQCRQPTTPGIPPVYPPILPIYSLYLYDIYTDIVLPRQQAATRH